VRAFLVMARAAPRPCTYPGCQTLVTDGSGRCARHPREPWVHKPDAPPRVRGRRLQRQRARLFAEHPLCAECDRHGRVRPAVIRDHIIPLAEGGTDEPTNIQGLCQTCSDAKTATEATRGRSRS